MPGKLLNLTISTYPQNFTFVFQKRIIDLQNFATRDQSMVIAIQVVVTALMPLHKSHIMSRPSVLYSNPPGPIIRMRYKAGEADLTLAQREDNIERTFLNAGFDLKSPASTLCRLSASLADKTLYLNASR